MEEGLKLIPVARPSITDEEIRAVAEVLRSAWLGPGQRVMEFEAAFAEVVGSAHAISTHTGTSALATTMAVLGVSPGDEVIIPTFTFMAAFQVVRHLGGTPVFADVEPDRFTLDPADVERRISLRTRGILAVHHGGHPANIRELQRIADRAGIWLIEDAAHALGGTNEEGRPYGSLCRASCFSLGPVKNLTTGDGGMITTPDADLARRFASYRSLGQDLNVWARYGAGTEQRTQRWAYSISGPGQRMHMNDIAAAMGLVQLRRLPEMNRRRGRLVARYQQAFADIKGFRWVEPVPDSRPNWHMFTVSMDHREEFISGMRDRGIAVGVHYHPVHLYPIAAPFHTPLPVTERIWQRVTTFPLFTDMTEAEQDRVIQASRELATRLDLV